MKRCAPLVIALLLTGCHPTRQSAPRVSPVPPSTVQVSHAPAQQEVAPPVSEITIAREPGMTTDPPPAYTLTLRSDGTATNIVQGFSKQTGTFQATIPTTEFVRLAKLVENGNFVSLEPFYGPAVTDIPEVRVSVVRKGKRKTVVDWGKPMQPKYEKEAPPALIQLEEQIDAAVAQVKWVKISDKAEAPRYIPGIPDLRK
ncbi:MAG: hypothetical protein JWN14_985 [Chthonomonadales bacterium]|nr:hypothetical protein [Chthonomonadales bacterium]